MQPKPDSGIVGTFRDLLSKVNLNCLTDLHGSPTLIVVSDYSGQQPGSLFEVYSLLMTGIQSLAEWEHMRLGLRTRFQIGLERISFKGLNDNRKRSMLPYFLNLAGHIPGIVITIAVQRSIRSLFYERGLPDLKSPELSQYAHFDAYTFERLLRIVHFVSFYVAEFSRPNQDVLWFTDQDAIAPNDGRISELTQVWAKFLGHYSQHNLGHIRFGTTKNDNGSLQIEDLASIPDLVAGALGELLNKYGMEGVLPVERLVLPTPHNLSRKSVDICSWLAKGCTNLNRLCYLIEKMTDSDSLLVKDLRLA